MLGKNTPVPVPQGKTKTPSVAEGFNNVLKYVESNVRIVAK